MMRAFNTCNVFKAMPFRDSVPCYTTVLSPFIYVKKKVLREHKRHTARRVASPWPGVGGTPPPPHPDLVRGDSYIGPGQGTNPPPPVDKLTN